MISKKQQHKNETKKTKTRGDSVKPQLLRLCENGNDLTYSCIYM